MQKKKRRWQMVKYIIILLFPVATLAQSVKIQLRKQIAPASLVFLAGACDGLNQVLNYQYKGFKRHFPGANDQFWYPSTSFQNKYKNGDPKQGARFPGSTTYLVFVSDGHHLTRFGEHLFLSGAIALKLDDVGKKRWTYILAEMGAYWFVNRMGFCLVYNSLK